MFEVRRLRLLRELAARGTIAAAAEACALTPSAVSQQLSLLEREARTPLFIRDGRRLLLTEAAHILVAHTERILVELEQARAEVAALGHGMRGTVRLVAFPSAAGLLAAPAMAECQEAHPDLRILLGEQEPERSLADLRAHRIDVALVYEYSLLPQLPDAGVELHPLLREPLLLALPPVRCRPVKNSRYNGPGKEPGPPDPGPIQRGEPGRPSGSDTCGLAGRDHPTGRTDSGAPGGIPAGRDDADSRQQEEPVTLNSLRYERWIAPCSDSALRQVLERACQAAGFAPQLDFTSDDFTVMMSLVQAGLGVSLIPSLAVGQLAPEVRLHPIADLSLTRTVSVAVRAGSRANPAIKALLGALRRAAGCD